MYGYRVAVAAKTDKTADRRHDVARRLYILGKSTILDLITSFAEIAILVFSLTQYLLVCENFGKSGVCCVLSGSGLLVALLAFQHSVSHSASDQLDSADRVVVAGAAGFRAVLRF